MDVPSQAVCLRNTNTNTCWWRLLAGDCYMAAANGPGYTGSSTAKDILSDVEVGDN
jgi:hypothetical protein